MAAESTPGRDTLAAFVAAESTRIAQALAGAPESIAALLAAEPAAVADVIIKAWPDVAEPGGEHSPEYLASVLAADYSNRS